MQNLTNTDNSLPTSCKAQFNSTEFNNFFQKYMESLFTAFCISAMKNHCFMVVIS